METQPSLFPELEPQADLFAARPAGRPTPRPEQVRGRIERFVSELEQADTVPWSPANLRLRLVIVPRMIGYLDAEEGAGFTARFRSAVERLCPERELPWERSA